jgi:C4-dicarboxylate-specific signal transduction histidine kinase
MGWGGLSIEIQLCYFSRFFACLTMLISALALRGWQRSWIRVCFSKTETEIEVSVTDSGKGIQLPLSDRIFEPFFITKEVGKGTGLGLSISKEIISRAGGTLELDLESVHTRFIIRLPRKREVSGWQQSKTI